MKHGILIVLFLATLLSGTRAQLLQGSLRAGTGNTVEVWLQPDFNNTNPTTGAYLFQIGLPIAFPASASPAPTGLNYTLAPEFVSTFGSNYQVTVNPVATANGGTEKYFNIVLVRGGVGASNPQFWKKDSAFRVLSFSFTPATAPATPVKLADYQDGGGDGQGNFYTQSGTAIYYVTANSVGNFFAIAGHSTVGGTASAGYAQTSFAVPFVCNLPGTPVLSAITTSAATVSWTPSGAPNYEWAVTTSATAPANGATVTSSPQTATGLDPNTAYWAHVRSACAGGLFSGWVSTPFTTQNLSCEAPAPATVTGLTATTATGQWTAVAGATGYEYQFSTSNAPPASGTPTAGLSAAATGLAPGTAQFLHLRTACTGGFFSSWVTTDFTTDCPGTAVPVVSGVTTTGATFTWPAVDGATGYEQSVTTSLTPPASGIALAGPTYTASGLDGGTAYYFHVRTVCAAGTSTTWSTVPFTTTCPGLPTAPTVTVITTTTATLGWTIPPGADGYEYVVSTVNTTPVGAGTPVAAASVNLTGLPPGTLHYAFVRSACDGGSFSGWSSVSFTTLGLSCPPPALPTITELTGTSARITWALGAGTTSSQYTVTTSLVPPATCTAPACQTFNNTTTTTALILNLSANTTYYAHVRASCGVGNFSGWTTALFKTPCSSPNLPQFAAITGSTATVNWSFPVGITNYEYTVSTSVSPPAGSTPGTQGTGNTLALTGLTGGTRYYVHVRAACGGTLFSPWVTANFSTTCAGPVVTSTIGPSTADMVWRAISGVRFYEQALTTYQAPLGGAATTDTAQALTGLPPGTRYFFNVRTYCQSGFYSGWTTVEFHTPGLEAYPNPVRATVRINLYGAEASPQGQLRLYDAGGKLVQTRAMTSVTETLNLRALAAGIYLLRYTDGHVKYTTKVLKE